MIELTDLELSTSKEIINIGLAKAADSLSFFMHEKTLIRSIDFELTKDEELNTALGKEDYKVYVLTTEIIGELGGSCYLVFTEEEVNRIYKISLPESITSSEEAMREMGPAMLLEIDNIVSASVVTQFSNLLNFKIFGGVPKLDEMKLSEFNKMLSDNNGDCENCVINFSAEFISAGENFNPQFIWVLDSKFFEGVKFFLQDSKNVEKLEGLKVTEGQ